MIRNKDANIPSTIRIKQALETQRFLKQGPLLRKSLNETDVLFEFSELKTDGHALFSFFAGLDVFGFQMGL